MSLQYIQNSNAPLLSWDIFSAQYNGLIEGAAKYHQSLASIKKIAKTNKWSKLQTDEALENIRKYVIVITDDLQLITFTCHGFELMTGYSLEEAKGRNPKFLQGDGTNRPNTNNIKEQLTNNNLCETILENYRKDGNLYLCKVIIKPIISINQKLVNYIAYEQEIAA